MNKGIFCLTLFLSLSAFTHVYAFKTNGYIIKNNGDTIKGEMHLHRTILPQKGVFLKGVDFLSLHLKTEFKAYNEKHFSYYSPDMIRGYGFDYKLATYKYKAFDTEPDNPLPETRHKKRFLRLIHHGFVDLYLDISVAPGEKEKHVRNVETFNTYYMYNKQHGLTKVETANQLNTLKDYLKLYHLDEAFTNEVPADLENKDLKQVLEMYDLWLNAPK